MRLRTMEYRPRRSRLLPVRPGNTESEILPRERGEIEVDAQHVVRAVQRQRVRKRDAQPGARRREVGPRDLDLAGGLDRAAEEGLGLPIGSRHGPYRRQPAV